MKPKTLKIIDELASRGLGCGMIWERLATPNRRKEFSIEGMEFGELQKYVKNIEDKQK